MELDLIHIAPEIVVLLSGTLLIVIKGAYTQSQDWRDLTNGVFRDLGSLSSKP